MMMKLPINEIYMSLVKHLVKELYLNSENSKIKRNNLGSKI